MSRLWSPATTPSGSRASSRYPWTGDELDDEDEGFGLIEEYTCHTIDEDLEMHSYQNHGTMMAGGILPHGVSMTVKTPPQFNGEGSWFAYEEAVRDWEEICLIDGSKRGPLLKNGLHGNAAVFKKFLSRELLRDPATGVDYFLTQLRPQFVKGASNIFLGRLIVFMKLRRNDLSPLQWITKYQLHLLRLQEAWMDLLSLAPAEHSHEYAAYYALLVSENRITRDIQEAVHANTVDLTMRQTITAMVTDRHGKLTTTVFH